MVNDLFVRFSCVESEYAFELSWLSWKNVSAKMYLFGIKNLRSRRLISRLSLSLIQ